MEKEFQGAKRSFRKGINATESFLIVKVKIEVLRQERKNLEFKVNKLTKAYDLLIEVMVDVGIRNRIVNQLESCQKMKTKEYSRT